MRISEERYGSGKVLVTIQDLLAEEGFSVFCAAVVWDVSSDYLNVVWGLQQRKAKTESNSPRRWVMVTFSRAGNSVISIPNRCLSSRCA